MARRLRGVQRPRRRTDWSLGLQTDPVSVNAGAISFVSIPLLNVIEAGTFVRTRGVFSVSPSNVAADAHIQGALGVGLLPIPADSAISEVPGPVSNIGWDGWMVWQPFSMDWESGASLVGTFADRTMEIDSRAMRKFDPHEMDLIVVVENSGTANAVYDYLLRFLQKYAS